VKSSILLVFLKFPEPGRVKTRLAATVGKDTATAIYKRLVRDVMEMARSAESECDLRILFDPPERESEVRDWLQGLGSEDAPPLDLAPQVSGDLGARLIAGFEAAFEQGYSKVAAIGTDCVEMMPETIAEAWQRLENTDAVFGPTHDGGYYMIGLRRMERRLFDVQWSSETTLAESLQRCEDCRFTTSLMDTKNDIDTNQEWAARKLQILEEATLGSQPLIFTPLYMERVWGGRTLQERFGRPLPGGNPFGESWELVDRPEAQSVIRNGPLEGITLGDLWHHKREEVFGRGQTGEHFPLLLKILDARDDLSLQVHPPAHAAESLGGEPKTEMWYVAHADPGAKLYAGLKKDVNAAMFQQSIQEGRAADYVHEIPVETGDFIFIPSGRIHAIGSGLLIYEIQQNSDTTYRVYDWNRMGLDGKPRELHLDEALHSIDFEDAEPKLGAPEGHLLVSCDKFVVERIELQAREERMLGGHGEFATITVVEGTVHCGDHAFSAGDFFVIPACAGPDLALHCGDGPASILRTTLPKSSGGGGGGGTLGFPAVFSDLKHMKFYERLRQRVLDWSNSEFGAKNQRWMEFLLMAPDLFVLICRLAGDSRVSARWKGQLLAVIAYFISPVDLLPEAMFGAFGYMDDLMLTAFILNRLINEIDPDIVRGHWSGRRDILELTQHMLNHADELLGGGLWKRVREVLG